MKKLIFALLMVVGLFANSYQIGTIQVSKKSLAYVNEDDRNKIITMIYLYNSGANINQNKLNEVEQVLVSYICTDDKLLHKINNGYVIEIIYMYKNNIVIRYEIDSCPM